MNKLWLLASSGMGLALLVRLVRVQLGVSVALVEIPDGAAVGDLRRGRHPPIRPLTKWVPYPSHAGSWCADLLCLRAC